MTTNYTHNLSVHPHDNEETLPERLTVKELRDFMTINQPLVFGTISVEWVGMIAAMYLSNTYWNPLLYLITVIFIGARQHGLLIIGHDASHYVLLKNKQWNDWVADIFLYWPMFGTVKGFRSFHSDHHRFLNTEKDKNRLVWKTHTADGQLTAEWTYPKKSSDLLLILLSKACFLTAFRWIIMGFAVMIVNSKNESTKFSPWYIALRLSFYTVILALLGYFHLLPQFFLYWIVPYCTWHVIAEYIRLICEHSAIQSDVKPYNLTRTTVTNFLDSLLLLPHNVGYHHEHHWYPSVPYYHLDKLHNRLAHNSNFGKYGDVSHSVYESLKKCIQS
ncbi:MAG: fatty acid desaturase family protein [Xenococcaceae cyanobacterium]